MKVSTIGIAVVAGIALGGIQGLGTTATFSGPGSIITAKAATSDEVVDDSTKSPDVLEGCTWKLTADGVLHLESGTLPEATPNPSEYANNKKISPFDGIQEFVKNNRTLSTISLDGKITAPRDSSYLFADLSAYPDNPDDKVGIEKLNNLNTEETTDFSDMFSGYSQGTLDVSQLKTGKATNMSGMFSGVRQAQGLEKLDTSNVTDMSDMFNNFGDLEKPVELDLSALDVSHVTQDGFYGMLDTLGVSYVNIGGWYPQKPLDNIFGSGAYQTSLKKVTLSSSEDLTDSFLPDLGTINFDPSDPITYTEKWENIKDQYIQDSTQKTTYTTSDLIGKYTGDTGDGSSDDTETYIWEPSTTPGNPVTVHYVDQDGKTIQADKQVPGDYGAKYDIAPDKIAGYDYVDVKDGSLTGTYDSEAKEVTLTYKKAAPTTGGTVTEPAADSSSEATSETPEADQPQTNPTNPVAKKNRAITAVKKLGLYRTPNFSKRTRIAYYPKQSRTKRPQFVILGVAQSKNGVKRYLVRDVNHGTKRDGKTGYITAKQAFSNHTYYQSNPKTVKVLTRTKGYRDKALKHQVKTYQPGKVLHVKKLVHYRLTTRLVLRDGTFVTGNKVKLIMQ